MNDYLEVFILIRPAVFIGFRKVDGMCHMWQRCLKMVPHLTVN